MISLPKNIAINKPVTRKGPKGISLFNVFLPMIINPKPIIAPRKNDEKRATKIFGLPRNIPIKNANFTSPKPIHLPFETNQRKKKKREAQIALQTTFNKSNFPKAWKKTAKTKYQMPEIAMAE